MNNHTNMQPAEATAHQPRAANAAAIAVIGIAATMTASIAIEAVRATRLEAWYFALPALIAIPPAIAAYCYRNRLAAILTRLSNRRFAFAAIILIPYLVQLTAVATIRTAPTSDFAIYWKTGKSLWTTGHYINNDPRGVIYRAHKTPGMAVYLAGVYGLFGDSVIAAQLTNIHLLLIGNLLFLHLTRRKLPPPIALAATAIFTFWPSRTLSGLLLGYEAPATCMLLLFWTFAESHTRNRWTTMLAAGVSLALATMLRVTLLPLFAAYLLYRLLTERRWQTVTRDAILLLFGFAIIFAPWTYRNYRIFGEPILTSTQGGVSFFAGMSPDTGRYWTTTTLAQLAQETGCNEQEMNRLGWQKGWQLLTESPSRSLWFAARKISRLLESDHEPATWVFETATTPTNKTILRIARNASCGLSDLYYTFLAITALLCSRRARHVILIQKYPHLIWPSIALIAMVLLHAIFWPQPRYFVVYQCFWAILVAAIWIPSDNNGPEDQQTTTTPDKQQ